MVRFAEIPEEVMKKGLFNNFLKLCFKICFCLGVSLLLSCSTPVKKAPRPKSSSSKSYQLFQQAQETLSSGTPQQEKQAIALLKKVISEDPESDLAAEATHLLADIRFKNRQYQQAYELYRQVFDSSYSSSFEISALLGGVQSLKALQRPSAAYALLKNRLATQSIPREKRVAFYELYYQLSLQESEPLEGLDILVSLIKDFPEHANVNYWQDQVDDILQAELSPAQWRELYERSRYRSIRGSTSFLLARYHRDLHQLDEARRFYQDVVDESASTLQKNSRRYVEANDFLNKMKSLRTVEPKTIGALLPLSGKHSKVAYKTLRGLQIAFGIYGEDNSPYRLAVVDSEGNPEKAQQAVEKLITEDHVITFVGSLLSRTAEATAQQADSLGVPSIALSQKHGLTEIGPSIFRHALTSRRLVEKLVDTAMDQYGLRNFAILYPNDAYGVEYANLFWDTVEKRGGQITGAQSYNPKETDFNGSIQRLVGTFYIEDRLEEYKLRLKEWKSQNTRLNSRSNPPDDLLPPLVAFEALFIPDSTRALGQIAPMLAYNDIKDIKLLGTNLWNTPSLLRRLSNLQLETLFVDHYIPHQVFSGSEFYKKYQEIFGEAPGPFSLQAYDTGLLIRQVLESGINTRAGFIRQLRQIRRFLGATGPLEITENNEIEQPLSPLVVSQKRIVPLRSVLDSAPNPTSDTTRE